MKKLILLITLACLSACSTGSDPAPLSQSRSDGLNPVPGSITYRGQPRTKLNKSPIGSGFSHEFYNSAGDRVVERYVIRADRSLAIVSRRIINLPDDADRPD
ncbi:hypothetical protein [Neorhizobium huautlense]|uniref:hypothetical protein n=1 Tax=Neorhizobium huautlense TaxID=67774 RepID=UPI0035942C6D